jgi:acetyl esterase/lipase
LLLFLLTGCATVPLVDEIRDCKLQPRVATLEHEPLDLQSVRILREPLTIGDHWALHLYAATQPDNYHAYRLQFPGSDGTDQNAHLLMPKGPGPHPAVVAFPILGGSHTVSEALAKTLASRNYAVLRMERRELFPDDTGLRSFDTLEGCMKYSLLDARRLLDWLYAHPRIDRQRIATAGVSMGGILAATFLGIDSRLQAGFFVMSGGGLKELFFDSAERSVREFRDRYMEHTGLTTREQFVDEVGAFTEVFDPVHYGVQVDPRRVLLVSARFDEVIPEQHTEQLWEAFGKPKWHKVPSGHYSIVPFFFWSLHRGVDHLDQVLGQLPQLQPRLAHRDLQPDSAVSPSLTAAGRASQESTPTSGSDPSVRPQAEATADLDRKPTTTTTVTVLSGSSAAGPTFGGEQSEVLEPGENPVAGIKPR